MNWFLAKIIFQVICGEGKHIAQFEEQIRLVMASDKLTAFFKANQLAMNEEECFQSLSKQAVQWKLIGVTDIYPLNVALDGAELFSGTRTEEPAEYFISSVKLRSNDLLNSASENYSF